MSTVERALVPDLSNSPSKIPPEENPEVNMGGDKGKRKNAPGGDGGQKQKKKKVFATG